MFKLVAGELLGFDEFIPTYATVTDQQMSRGVNYASGGAGIREETASHMVWRLTNILLNLEIRSPFLTQFMFNLVTG